MPRFPSGLQRHQGGEPDITPKRREPSAKQLAMLTAEQYKAWAESKGVWVNADRESISRLSNPANFDRRNL